MNGKGGWTAAALVAIATTIGISSFEAKPPTVPASAQKTAVASGSGTAREKDALEKGPCADLEALLQAFFVAPQNSIAAPGSCYPKSKAANVAASKLQEASQSLHFVIATLPDPLHTHFPLIFDRATEAIQQAAQDRGYLYDSSWLPWETEQISYARIEDQDEAEERKQQREDQPGLLLFRAPLSADRSNANQLFSNGLAVFIVGEEPTGGIHRGQFENAVAWIKALRGPGKETGEPDRPVQIIGPSFSGSLPSLAELLGIREIADILRPGANQLLQIFSGNVTSDAGMAWMQKAASTGPLQSLNIDFRSFQQSDKVALELYCRYLRGSGYALAQLAIVSEDETAFGGEYGSGQPETSPCRPEKKGQGPAYLYYPRDISALRAAYQKQSIFSRAATKPADATVGRTLETDLADPEGRQHDAVRNYSGDQTALSQEAELQQIVSTLRAHRSVYILLRSSNPLDQLFLSHFLRLAYPQGRIVIVGADLLLRRETGSSGLTGIMTLSTYPLLAWESDWTKPQDMRQFHSHRIFTHDGAEGTYVATRFLLHTPVVGSIAPDEKKRCEAAWAAANFLPPNCDSSLTLRDYAPPFWMKRANDQGRRPPTWLSVLGNGGFWPVAALDLAIEPRRDPESDTGSLKKTLARIKHSLSSLSSSIVFLLGFRAAKASAGGDEQRWPEMPLSMNLCLLGGLFWAVFHAICCSRPSITVKPSHRAHFIRTSQRSHLALILCGSVLVALLPITLAWAYGEMSETGEPLPHPWPYRAVLPLIWAIAGFALCANVWIETYFRKMGDTVRSEAPFLQRLKYSAKIAPQVPRVIWRPLALYAGISFALYYLLDLSLDGALNEGNRIPTYWRAMDLTGGVSPLAPLLALTLGLYGWFWYSLQGEALFGEDRPVLPSAARLKVSRPNGREDELLRMLSREWAAAPIERLCSPFSGKAWTVAAIGFAVVTVVAELLSGDVPVRALGAKDYSVVFCLWLALCISVLLGNVWQLLYIWLNLRHLLTFLDKLPLRRTLEALKGYSWGSVWKMGGNVLDVRYKLIFRQLESLSHLRTSLLEWGIGAQTPTQCLSACRWVEAIDKTRSARVDFARWYSLHWNDWTARDLSKLRRVQYRLARTAAMMLTELLIPSWREERESLVLDIDKEADGETGKSKGVAGEHPVARLEPHIQNAEELVCFVYMGFIQNILGRMRTLALGIICLFFTITVAVSSYPFDPRPVLSGAVIALFLVVGAVIVMVYSQMHRDATLSHLTNTKPGELGVEFWLKLAGFGIGPVLGLLASVFPELTSFLFSWLQPGLSSIK